MVLNYLLIDDLFRHGKPSHLDFGKGDGSWKQVLANETMTDATLLQFRKGLGSRIRIGSHRVFRGGVRLCKRLLRHARPVPPQADATEAPRGSPKSACKQERDS
jgi:hypothetical protein